MSGPPLVLTPGQQARATQMVGILTHMKARFDAEGMTLANQLYATLDKAQGNPNLGGCPEICGGAE